MASSRKVKSNRKIKRKVRGKSKPKKSVSRRFGSAKVYKARITDGILLANNAFQWENNPMERALNAAS
jgi:hypothetical protein